MKLTMHQTLRNITIKKISTTRWVILYLLVAYAWQTNIGWAAPESTREQDNWIAPITNHTSLLEVDEVRITILMDNIVDLLMANRDVAKRFDIQSKNRLFPLAEHGFSALIQVKRGEKQETVVLDAGISSSGILHNIEALGNDLTDVKTIVLSHGHGDHTGGLPGLIEKLGSQQVSVVYHPDAFLEKKLVLLNGNELNVSAPKLADLYRENISFVGKKDTTLLANNMIMVSGEIPRTTSFEKGLSTHYIKRNDQWEKDPLVMEEQCVIINLRGQGLVVITGCSHTGLINSIRYAQKLTNIPKVHAIVGGFHLTGGFYETIIPNTIAELQKINPTYVMPGHCTGWSATHKIAEAMPQAFIANSVGTTLVFKAKQE